MQHDVPINVPHRFYYKWSMIQCTQKCIASSPKQTQYYVAYALLSIIVLHLVIASVTISTATLFGKGCVLEVWPF